MKALISCKERHLMKLAITADDENLRSANCGCWIRDFLTSDAKPSSTAKPRIGERFRDFCCWRLHRKSPSPVKSPVPALGISPPSIFLDLTTCFGSLTGPAMCPRPAQTLRALPTRNGSELLIMSRAGRFPLTTAPTVQTLRTRAPAPAQLVPPGLAVRFCG
jgi:hypothetical protein